MQHLTDDRPMACLDHRLPSLPALGALHVAERAGELVRAAVRAGWIVVLLVALPGVLS